MFLHFPGTNDPNRKRYFQELGFGPGEFYLRSQSIAHGRRSASKHYGGTNLMNKRKLVKIIVCGVVVVIVVTVLVINNEEVIHWGATLVEKMFPENCIAVTSDAALHQIADPSKCTDLKWIQYVIDIEEKCHLQKGELVSLMFNENSLGHASRLEADGIMSYGASQMRLGTAKAAHAILKAKGIILQEPTIELLKNDRNYLTEITGRYLEHLHTLFPDNPRKVWNAWNAGVEALPRFASRNHIYEYTNNMIKHIAHFGPIVKGGL